MARTATGPALYDTWVWYSSPPAARGRRVRPSRRAWPWAKQPDPAPASPCSVARPSQPPAPAAPNQIAAVVAACAAPVPGSHASWWRARSALAAVCGGPGPSEMAAVDTGDQGDNAGGWNQRQTWKPGHQPFIGFLWRRLPADEAAPVAPGRPTSPGEARQRATSRGADAPASAGRRRGGGHAERRYRVQPSQRRRPPAPGVGERTAATGRSAAKPSGVKSPLDNYQRLRRPAWRRTSLSAWPGCVPVAIAG